MNFFEATITLLPKDKDTTKNEDNYRLTPLININ